MLAMALPPAPPTPITLIRGRSSSTSGRMKSMLMSLNLPQTLQRVEPSGRIFESLRVASQAEKLTRTKKGGESVVRKTQLSTRMIEKIDQPNVAGALQASGDAPRQLGAEGLRFRMRDADQRFHLCTPHRHRRF